MKKYKNMVWFGSGPLDRCLANAIEFDSIPKCRKFAKKYRNAHIARAWFSDGNLLWYQEW